MEKFSNHFEIIFYFILMFFSKKESISFGKIIIVIFVNLQMTNRFVVSSLGDEGNPQKLANPNF